jgi:hypothetical protein
MATIIEQPRKGPLHGPPPGNHVEALPLFIGRGLHVDCVRLLQASHPLLEPLGRISTLNPYVAPPLDTISTILGSSLHSSQALIRAGIRHDHGHEQPQPVNQDLPLAPCDLLVAIKPDVFVLGRCLDTL